MLNNKQQRDFYNSQRTLFLRGCTCKHLSTFRRFRQRIRIQDRSISLDKGTRRTFRIWSRICEVPFRRADIALGCRIHCKETEPVCSLSSRRTTRLKLPKKELLQETRRRELNEETTHRVVLNHAAVHMHLTHLSFTDRNGV